MGRSGRRVQSFRQFDVHDDACAMKVGTDALVLGSWAGASLAENRTLRVLDVGTGSGILALMVAQRFPKAQVDAIDLEPDAAVQAAENAARSPFADRIHVAHCALQGWEVTGAYDLVVCNPPFFHNHPKSEDRKRNLARHDDALPLDVLFGRAARLLTSTGRLEVVHPWDRSEEFRGKAQASGFHVRSEIALRATPAHACTRVLWSLSLAGSAQHVRETWELEAEEGGGTWSPRLRKALAPFVPGVELA